MRHKREYVMLGLIVFFTFSLRFFSNFYTLDFQILLILPAILSSITAVLLFYFGSLFFKDYDTGLIASFLFVISPWHIALSLQNITAVLFVLFLTLSVYLMIKKQSKALFTACILATIALLVVILNTYQTIPEIAHEQHKTVIRYIVATGQGQNLIFIRLFHNKIIETIRFSLFRLSTYFEPEGFFLTNTFFFGKKILGAGFILTSLFPFFIIEMIDLLQQKVRSWFLPLWIFLSVFPGLVSIHHQHMVLASAMIVPLILVSSYALTKLIKQHRVIGVFAFIIIGLNFLFVFSQYLPIIW